MGLWDNNYISYWGQNKKARDAAKEAGNTDAAFGYQSNMNSAVGGAALTALQGAAGILDTSLQMAEVPDTSAYQNQIDQMGMFRDGKTWDMNQLIANRSSIQPVHVDYDDVGGITTAGIVGGTLSSGLSGLSAGAAIGGVPGAIIGGLAGIGAGLWGGITGHNKTEDRVAALNAASKYQEELNNRYFNIQADRINDYNYGNMFAYRAAQGGKIHIKKSNRGKFTEAAKRHHMSVQEFAKHVLSNNNKSKYSATMRKRANFARNAAGWKHAEGGQIETISDMEKFNTHGGYYAPDNLVRINTGGTHEQNPNGGVQYGMDQQGIPNLVEENENIYNDYVFSERIKATKSELKKYGLPEKYDGMSFSSIADKLSAEARQRPNDAVSANGMGAMLDRLQACQEDHKARLEQSRMRRELNNMSPEELMALGAQMAQQPIAMPQEQMPMQEAQPMVEAPMMQQEMPMEQAPLMAACGGHIHRRLGDGTPGEIVIDPNAVLPEVYVPEDATIRGMQHFDERQERNAALNKRIKDAVSLEGREDMYTGMVPFAGVAPGIGSLGTVAKAVKTAKNLAKGTAIVGTAGTLIPLGVNKAMKWWGGLGEVSTNPVDNVVGKYEKPVDTKKGSYGAHVEGYAAGGKLVRRYDRPGWLNEGPITAAIMTPPEYYDEYSYFTNNPIHTTGKVEWVRHPADASATGTLIVTTPEEEAIFDGPLMADGTYAKAQSAYSSSGKGKASGKSVTARKSYDAITAVKPPLGPGLVAADNKYGYILPSSPVKAAEAIAAAEDRRLRNNPNMPGHWTTDMIGPQYKKPEEWEKEIANEKAKEAATTTDPSAFPTWMRYAGAIGNAGLAMYNAFQEPDKLNLGYIKPVFVNGRMALQRQRFNPMDQQSMVNPVLTNTAAGYRAINNSGLGASTGAAMIAAMSAGNQGIGNATTQGRLYNDQLLSNVIQQNNAAEQAEANFYNRINTTNAQIANNAIMQNYYGNMRQQMYNNEQESAKWNAVSSALDASLTDLSNIGRENFIMNQINSNKALLGYKVGADGWAHYTTEDGYEVIADPKTGAVQQVLSPKEAASAAVTTSTPTVASMSNTYQIPKITLPTIYGDAFGRSYTLDNPEIQQKVNERIAALHKKHGLD